MPDYTLGKIYKICSNNPDIVEVYYGSTTQTLCCRMSGHRAAYKRWIDNKCEPCSIHHYFKQYGVGQFHIELVENYSCDNKEQLLSYENKFIRDNECVNKNSAIQTVEKRKERDKQYYQDNKEKVKERTKQYSEDNKEKIKQYQVEYRETNKDKINEQRRQRRLLKKESN